MTVEERLTVLERAEHRRVWMDTYLGNLRSTPALPTLAERDAFKAESSRIATEIANQKHGELK